MQGSSFIKTLNFVYSSYIAAFRLTYALSIQYLRLSASVVLLYGKVKHQRKFDCIPSIFRRSYTMALKQGRRKHCKAGGGQID